MTTMLAVLAAVVLLVLGTDGRAQQPDDPGAWTIYIANDNCPDYTWGFTEEQTRQAFADIVRGHLDEMQRTDGDAPEDRSRYNMAVTQEALCFVERYPERRAELIRRIEEGRVCISPYLCNSLWAFQSVESAIRTLYPARRLEREWGLPACEVAEHIEEPSLPWGVASILAGCGLRWLSNPFYGYDSTFAGLTNAPVFAYEGPDGNRLRVVMDPWASGHWSYTQGAALLRGPELILREWLPHYADLGAAYPFRAILASGTHGDINPGSGGQAQGFTEAIRAYNQGPAPRPALVNATLAQFCAAVDEAEAQGAALPLVRGCFGHSWDVWPVSLARYVADTREGERAFLAAEALLGVAAQRRPELVAATAEARRRAEWCWVMLCDHAWNGTDEANRRDNAELRRAWSAELNDRARALRDQAWEGLGLEPSEEHLVILNGTSVPRRELVRLPATEGVGALSAAGQALPSQVVEEGGQRVLYALAPPVPGFGLGELELRPRRQVPETAHRAAATPTGLESPFYRLTVDTEMGGLTSLVHRPTGRELVVPDTGRSLCQTVYFDGGERAPADVRVSAVASGPVLGRLLVEGTLASIRVRTWVTVYADLDRVDFEVRVQKPVSTQEQRLCQVFPVSLEGGTLRVETTGAVMRPRPQPEGDLLPGADQRRFAVQGFVDVSQADGPGVTIAPLDSFVLRLDLGPLTFEALGNDQNYREVVQDQNGETEFRFRYALRAHEGPYDGAEAFAWSRSVATPLLVTPGRLPAVAAWQPPVVDPARAIATCLKPMDDEAMPGCLLRLWETSGSAGPLTIPIGGFRRAFRTDLLERDQKELPVTDGRVTLDLPAHGLAALRLAR